MSIKLQKILTIAFVVIAVFTISARDSQAAYTLSEGQSLWMRTSLPAPGQFNSMTFFWSINWWLHGDYKVQYTVYRPADEYGQIFPNWQIDLIPFWGKDVIVEFKVTEGTLEFRDSCWVFDDGKNGGINETVPYPFYFGFYSFDPELGQTVVGYMPGEVLESEPPHGDLLYVNGPLYLPTQNIRSDFIRGFEMRVDIKPESSPNPINPSSNGVIPAAIPGGPGFVPELFDPDTVNMEGIRPLRYYYADEVAYSSDCDCFLSGSDGYDDMVLQFDAEEVAEYLKRTGYKEIQDLRISAKFLGFLWIGRDEIKIVP